MKLRNLSNIEVPRKLWHALAGSMGLGSHLPQAITDEFGIYGRNTVLRISVNPELERNQYHADVVVGSYTFGHIALFPCPRCSTGFLTYTLLHELHHAWLHQYDEPRYEKAEVCTSAEKFARDAFRMLGGRIIPPEKCADFTLDKDLAMSRLQHGKAIKSLLKE